MAFKRSPVRSRLAPLKLLNIGRLDALHDVHLGSASACDQYWGNSGEETAQPPWLQLHQGVVAALPAADEVRMLRRGAVEFRGYPLAQLSCHMLGAISEIDHLFRKLCERPHVARMPIVVRHGGVPALQAVCQGGVAELPSEPPEPTPSNLPFQVAAGIHTSKPIDSEDLLHNTPSPPAVSIELQKPTPNLDYVLAPECCFRRRRLGWVPGSRRTGVYCRRQWRCRVVAIDVRGRRRSRARST